MVELCDGCSSLVDAAVGFVVNISSDLVLLLRIRNDFLALQPQLFRFVVFARRELVVRRCTPETTLFGPVGAIRVLSVLEVKADLIEALFRDEVVLSAKIATVDDSVD